LKAHIQNVKPLNLINIFHHNIRGLKNKTDELLHYFEMDNTNPHILCLGEHHMVEQELRHLAKNGYLLSSSFGQKGLQRGGVVFLLRQIDISLKLIFQCTVRRKTLKTVL
jgi:hypothetical protein